MASIAMETKSDTLSPLHCKWGKVSFTVEYEPNITTVGELKEKITEETSIPKEGIKLLNLKIKKRKLDDTCLISDCKLPKILKVMGTAQADMLTNDADLTDLPDVIDDFNLGNMMGNQLGNASETYQKLMKSIQSTPIKMQLMNEPREGKKLLVLDLDHTILDFKNATQEGGGLDGQGFVDFESMKRPGVDAFLTAVYQNYDIVIWSQTSLRWLEIKLQELGFLRPDRPYKFLFVLTKECMFRVRQKNSKGKIKKKACKPLQLIWTKFQQYTSKNSVHLDDLATNFCLNPKNGLKCSAFYRAKPNAENDCELLLWAKYLDLLAKDEDVTLRDHSMWLTTLQQEATDSNSGGSGGSTSNF
jgi:ubiquitin-like domain-containing CTD phosphatase 1